MSYARLLAFAALHVACVAAIWTGIPPSALALCAAVWVFQLLSVTIGYHRYFSHRSFKTSRAMQFVLALCATASLQKGVLWWAAHHRYHHRHSDQHDDIHSPNEGLFWSYAGWIFHDSAVATREDQVKDPLKYPELRFLDRFHFLPSIALAALCYAIGGPAGLVVGYFWATILSHHATFANNCFAHIFGTQPYETGDRSRNNWFLAAITLGEGWHNNHHRYPGSARNGFFWWQIDPTYGVLLLLDAIGLVWDLRQPPPELLTEQVERWSSER
jgi:stearoyl-CoA desaturase (delta-9 desaturase)